MKKNTTTILALLLLLVLTTACDPQSLEGPTPAPEYGRICLSVSTHPEISIITREGSTLTNDQLTSYEIIVKDEDKKEIWKKEHNAPLTDMIVPAGTYTITATNLTKDEAYPNNTAPGQVRVSGKSDVITVNAGASSECDIICKPINSKITIEYTEEFKKAFPECVASLIQDERTVIVGENDEAFFEAGENAVVTWTLDLNKEGIDNNPSGTITPEAGKWTIITFDAKTSTDGSLSLSVTVDGQVEEVTINQGFNPYKIRQ